jgi:hypothetical protein
MLSHFFRVLVFIAMLSVSLIECSSTPTTPSASSTPTTVPGPNATVTPSLPPAVLPGTAAGLPAVAGRVPFTGHLLIAENSGTGVAL